MKIYRLYLTFFLLFMEVNYQMVWFVWNVNLFQPEKNEIRYFYSIFDFQMFAIF